MILLVGILARFFMPSREPMNLMAAILSGIVGAVVDGAHPTFPEGVWTPAYL